MSGAISNQFSNRFVSAVVNEVYDNAQAGDSIPMSDGVKNRYAYIDTNHDGRLSRREMTEALTHDNFRLSLENAGRPNYGLAARVISFMDGADGIRGGVIRTSNADVSADAAAHNLADGNWTIGKSFFTANSGPTLEVHQNAKGPKITMP